MRLIYLYNIASTVKMTKSVTIAEDCESIKEEEITDVLKEEHVDDDSNELVDTDDEDDGSEESDFEPQMDFGQLLSNFFVTENGVNVADAIMELKASLDTHNKLLHKYIKSKLST